MEKHSSYMKNWGRGVNCWWNYGLSKLLLNFIKKLSFFIKDFEGSYEVLSRREYFWSTNFWKWNTGPFKTFLKIYAKMHFVSSFFLNERNIAVSLLMIHLKYSVVHYTNLNSSSINKSFLNCGPSNVLFRFFRFLIYIYLKEAFIKNFMKKNYHLLM